MWCASYAGRTTTGGSLGFTVTGAPGLAVGPGYSCDPGFSLSQIGLTTRWTPVKNLTFSSEVMYSYLQTNMKGSVFGTTTSAFPLPGGAATQWVFGNQGTVSANFRVQRNF